MSIESKTTFPLSFVLDIPKVVVANVEPIVIQVDNQVVKQLMEENRHLREEIKALKQIIKNTNN
jgi:hypothetical protein